MRLDKYLAHAGVGTRKEVKKLIRSKAVTVNEEDIIKLNNKIAESDNRNKRIDGIIKKIDELKSEISLIFMRTQNLIISSYFDNTFDKISNLEELENYRKKLYSIKYLLGYMDGYTFFNDYYVAKMDELEKKYNAFENRDVVTAIKLITKKENKLVKLFNMLKKLLFGRKTQEDI